MGIKYHHAVFYGIGLDKLYFNYVLLEVNPDWKGESDKKNPHWLRSNTKIEELDQADARQAFCKRTGNIDLIMGYVFPDGSIDRNLCESNELKTPTFDNVGELCYLNVKDESILGKLLLFNSAVENGTTEWEVADLKDMLESPSKLVQEIDKYRFDISVSGLKIIQQFYTTPE